MPQRSIETTEHVLTVFAPTLIIRPNNEQMIDLGFVQASCGSIG
jgi:hypothetical protein